MITIEQVERHKNTVSHWYVVWAKNNATTKTGIGSCQPFKTKREAEAWQREQHENAREGWTVQTRLDRPLNKS